MRTTSACRDRLVLVELHRRAQQECLEQDRNEVQAGKNQGADAKVAEHATGGAR